MNLQSLLVLTDSLYPNAESDSNKVAFMNLALNDLTKFFGLIVTDVSLTTVDGQDEYTFPTGLLDVSQIILLDIETQATPDNRYDYTRYVKGYSLDMHQTGHSYFQAQSSAGVKSLILYPAPDVTGLNVRIRYRKQLTSLSSTDLTASPEFDPAFHDALAFYCVHTLCSIGPSADEGQANFYMQKYKSVVGQIGRAASEEKNRHPIKPKENRQWLR